MAQERSARTGAASAGLAARLFAPVDIASLVLFRIAFGALLLLEVGRYLQHDWIGRYFVDPAFHFTWPAFSWVRPWPGDGMYWHFAGLGIAALLVMVGLWYRLAAALLCAGFSYVFLLERARYLNHVYLICLVAGLMVFVPAHRALSLDSRLRPALRSQTAPAWSLWLLRAQIGIVYVYGGIAKLDADWLMGWPLRLWWQARAGDPLLGGILVQDWAPLAFAWGGALFDLSIVPALLWRRTRGIAVVAAVAFHLTNHWLFHIGVFPALALAMTLLFLPSSWPRRLLRRVHGGTVAAPAPAPTRAWLRRAGVAVLAAYFAVQLAVPLRHWLYPGEVAWTEEGHEFAWRMKLRSKDGCVTFLVHAPGAAPCAVEARRYATDWQEREMVKRPELIRQLAGAIADDWRRHGRGRVAVHALAVVSLNGRAPQALIDPEVDLAAQPPLWFGCAPWILPLRATRTRAVPLPAFRREPRRIDGAEAQRTRRSAVRFVSRRPAAARSTIA